MADNLTLPAAGAVVATDDVGGFQYQRVKPAFGVDGAAIDASALNPFPVTDIDSTATGALAAAAANVAVLLQGKSAAAIQITGTWVGTLAFEGTLDGTTWQAINAVGAATSVPVTSTQANGLFRLTPGGLAQIRVNMTAFGSGSAVVSMRASAATGGVFANQVLPVTTPSASASGSITTQNLVPGGVATAGSAVELVLSGTNALSVQVTGTYSGALSLQVMLDGTNWVTVGGTPFLSANTSGYLAAITSGLQGIFQTEVTSFLRARITALAAVTGAAVVTLISTAGAPAMVALDAAIPAGTNNIGAVTLASTTVTASTPVTPTTTFVNSVATTNATLIKNSAGTLWSAVISNSAAAARFVKLFNLAVAPTVGTSVPVLTIAVPAGGTVSVTGGSNGLRFATGIALSITAAAADADATAVAVSDVKAALSFT